MVENKFDIKIKVLRSDKGGEYTTNVVQNFLRAPGIESQTS